MNYVQLGKNIKQARKTRNVTQELLAERVNLSAVFLSQIETAARKPSLETVYHIARALDVSLDALTQGFEEEIAHRAEQELAILLHRRSPAEIRLITDVAYEILKHTREDRLLPEPSE